MFIKLSFPILIESPIQIRLKCQHGMAGGPERAALVLLDQFCQSMLLKVRCD
jgi:hypothetical protein